jgi:hypothetical protein
MSHASGASKGRPGKWRGFRIEDPVVGIKALPRNCNFYYSIANVWHKDGQHRHPFPALPAVDFNAHICARCMAAGEGILI